jgi:lipoprotein-anchoring transpeptidase ErfK/SrfK
MNHTLQRTDPRRAACRRTGGTASSTAGRTALGVLSSAALVIGLAACGSSSEHRAVGGNGSTPVAGSGTSSSASNAAQVKLTSSVHANAANLAVDAPVTLSATGGTLTEVVFQAGPRILKGRYNGDHTRWTAPSLDQGTRYVIRAAAADDRGRVIRRRLTFSTRGLTKDQQTYPAIMPASGQVVGVGMPVIVNFDVAVKNRAAFERKMIVKSTPAQKGSWYWLSDNVAHWRPEHYWKPGTKVEVAVDVKSVHAGNGIYGQLDQHAHFTVGDSIVLRANLRSDQMRVFINGKFQRSIPVTGGQPGLETRSGIKLVMEKFNSLRMSGDTVGIPKNSPQYYDIPDVRFAERVTNSGEFFHAAPWSTYAQGHINVSHGCMGMSLANAYWLYQRTHIGDVVVVTGSHRSIEPGNGWTDWNVSWADYQKGSALI